MVEILGEFEDSMKSIDDNIKKLICACNYVLHSTYFYKRLIDTLQSIREGN